MSMKDLYLTELNQGSWDSFVRLFEKSYLQVDPKWAKDAEQRGIPADISQVILCEMGEYALRWMDMKVPALGDESPARFPRKRGYECPKSSNYANASVKPKSNTGSSFVVKLILQNRYVTLTLQEKTTEYTITSFDGL